MNRTRNSLVAGFLAAGLLVTSLTGAAFAARSHQTKPGTSGHHDFINYMASVEGVTSAVLQQELKSGKTLLQIAGSKYASADDLATALLARVKTRLDLAVKDNKLSGAQENTVYSSLHTRMAKLVVTPYPFGHGGLTARKGAAGGHAGNRTAVIQTMAATCGTTQAALQAAFKAGGKTPLAICQATKPTVTQDTLVSALVSAFKTKLDAGAKTMGITAQQESKILARIQTRLNQWVVTPIAAGGSRIR